MCTKRLLAITFVMLIPFKVEAIDVDYSAAIEIASYDNLNLLNQSPGTELSKAVRGEISITENTADLDANFELGVESITFREGQASDETVVSLMLDCLVSISPSIFEWYVSEIYAQTPIDVLMGDVSLNRQDASAFSTGPNYHIRINRANLLTLESRVGNYQYEISDADNNRISGAVIWSLRINPALTMALNSELQSVQFGNQIVYQDYNRYDYFLELIYRRGFNQYTLEVGQTNLEYDYSEATDELRYLLAVETIRTSVSRLRLEVSHEVADTASQLESLIGEDFGFYNLAPTSSDLYVNELFRLTYNQDLSLGNYSIQISAESNKYERQFIEDYDRYGLILRAEWFLRQDAAITFDSRFYNIQRYNVIPESEVDDYYYGLGYRYNARRNVVINYQAIYQERDSINFAETYKDMRFLISLIYTSA